MPRPGKLLRGSRGERVLRQEHFLPRGGTGATRQTGTGGRLAPHRNPSLCPLCRPACRAFCVLRVFPPCSPCPAIAGFCVRPGSRRTLTCPPSSDPPTPAGVHEDTPRPPPAGGMSRQTSGGGVPGRGCPAQGSCSGEAVGRGCSARSIFSPEAEPGQQGRRAPAAASPPIGTPLCVLCVAQLAGRSVCSVFSLRALLAPR